MLSLPWAQVHSLVGELRSRRLCGMAKGEKKKEQVTVSSPPEKSVTLNLMSESKTLLSSAPKLNAFLFFLPEIPVLSPTPLAFLTVLRSVSFGTLSRVPLFATPRTVARQIPLYMGIPRQEYWIEFPFPSSGDLPIPGIELASPASSGKFFTTHATWGVQYNRVYLGISPVLC